MYCICDACIALRVSPKSPNAVCLSAVTDICPHIAHALLSPAKNWTFQQDDGPLQHKNHTSDTGKPFRTRKLTNGIYVRPIIGIV